MRVAQRAAHAVTWDWDIHAGTIRWNDAEASWDCPLHGSRFAPDGVRLLAKAEWALEKDQLDPAFTLFKQALELDPQEFWRIHRGILVRVDAISEVTRDYRGRQIVHVRNHPEHLEVSRNHSHLFQQM